MFFRAAKTQSFYFSVDAAESTNRAKTATSACMRCGRGGGTIANGQRAVAPGVRRVFICLAKRGVVVDLGGRINWAKSHPALGDRGA